MYLLFFVSRLRVEARSKTPVVYLRYKAATDGCEAVEFNEQLLNAFCFPLGPDAVQPKEVQASEEYTFTLTHQDGQRFTGFCRQIFPPAPRVGSKARYPEVLCIVAENPWCRFFFKVLQVAEQILKGYEGMLDSSCRDLPLDSQLGAFLKNLQKQLGTNPRAGEILRVAMPNLRGLCGVSPPRYMGGPSIGETLNWSDDLIELQVPPDCGNGKANSGIPLARLLFHVPVDGMLTLVASLLLERRIVFLARSRDTVSAAVQAAQALIYPFRWQHIYLPLLPSALVDYLSAPMPFLVGVTSDMLPLVRNIPMSEVTTVDLDLQKVLPPPGAQYDDGRALPYGRYLGAALEAVFKTVRSPTEYESSPIITGVMQEYFVRLFGSYRRYIHDQSVEPLLRSLPCASTSSGWSHHRGFGGRDALRSGRDGRDSRGGIGHHHTGSDCTASPHGSHSANRLHDDMLRGHGYYFDHPSFVAHRRSEILRAFLNAMRHSQMYQMFIQERLQMATSGAIELPPSSSSYASSFSATSAGCGRARNMLNKSSSAHNLSSLDRTFQGSVQGLAQSGVHASELTVLRELTSTGGSGHTSGGGADQESEPEPASALDPFELRVQRYPEHRRMVREHLRSVVPEMAATGSGGGGRLARRLRGHRRTDSEDLHMHPHAFGSVHALETMRRITTYPGIVDVSHPSLDEPATYFVEWDMLEDDEDDFLSPSPSPRGQDPVRSESVNSLVSTESADPASSSGGSVQPTTSGTGFVPSSRGVSGQGGRDNSSLARLSGSMLAGNAKSTYTCLRGTSYNDLPAASDRGGAVAAVGGVASAVFSGLGVTRMAAAGSNSNGGVMEQPAATVTLNRGGVQVKTLPDGQRVYDGSIKDFMRLAAAEAKNSLLSGLSGLASPLGSPRGKDKEAQEQRRPRSQQQHQQQQQRSSLTCALASPQQSQQAPSSLPLQQREEHSSCSQSAPIPMMTATPVTRPASTPPPGIDSMQALMQGGSAASVASVGTSGRVQGHGLAITGGQRRDDLQQQHNTFSTLFFNLKDRMTGNKALGVLPTVGYKPQTTGEKAAKFKAQLTGGSGAPLLAGADGKLKQPHAPQRPLSLTGWQASAWGRNEVPEASTGFPVAPSPPTPSHCTPSASPAATPVLATGPVEVSPFAPRVHSRAQSMSGIPSMPSESQHSLTAGGNSVTTGGAMVTPPTGCSSAVTGPSWKDANSQLLNWDPFGMGSAAPLPNSALSGASALSHRNVAPSIVIAATSTAASPFAVTSSTDPPIATIVAPVSAAACTHAKGTSNSSPDASTADLLGLSQSAASGSSSFAAPIRATYSGAAFDPFAASDNVTEGSRLESAGSNDFAAFASASSPREIPGLAPFGSTPLVS